MNAIDMIPCVPNLCGIAKYWLRFISLFVDINETAKAYENYKSSKRSAKNAKPFAMERVQHMFTFLGIT